MRKALNVYVLATQLIFTLLVMAIAGILLGKHLDPEGSLNAILAGVGLIIGLMLDVLFIFQFMRFQARNEKASSEVDVIED